MTSCGRRNARKRREIKNGEEFISLEIVFKIDCLDNREVTSSESRDHLGRSGSGELGAEGRSADARPLADRYVQYSQHACREH